MILESENTVLKTVYTNCDLLTGSLYGFNQARQNISSLTAQIVARNFIQRCFIRIDLNDRRTVFKGFALPAIPVKRFQSRLAHRNY